MGCIKLPTKVSSVAMYLKTFSFKDYINNHLGFSFMMSRLFLMKDTKQAYRYFCFFEKKDGDLGGWAEKESKRVEKMAKISNTHTFP